MQNYTTWEVHKDFVSSSFDAAKGGICVRVSVLKIYNPRFSMAFGWKLPSGELKIHIQQDMDFDPAEVDELVSGAKAHIKTELASLEKIRLQREEEQRLRDEEDKQKKMVKKKRYEDNKKARAEENRHRASGSGKKNG